MAQSYLLVLGGVNCVVREHSTRAGSGLHADLLENPNGKPDERAFSC